MRSANIESKPVSDIIMKWLKSNDKVKRGEIKI